MNAHKKKGCIAVFTKTPGLTPVKTRLAKTIGNDKAQEAFIACVETLHGTLNKFIKTHPEWDVIWATAEEEGVDHPFWEDKSFNRLWTEEGELGTRLNHIYQTLRAEYQNIIFIGADCPHISVNEFEQAIHLLDQHPTIAGPTHDGGYYLFGASKTDIPRETWESVPYSQSNTLKEFIKRLEGNTYLMLPKTDLDEIDDITALLNEINLMQKQHFHHIKNTLKKLL